MKRVWVVDDKIPLETLYDGPYPIRIDTEIVRNLVNEHEEKWDEKEVLALCKGICDGAYESAFFKSPESMLVAMGDGLRPPHVIIFDWEYGGVADSVERKVKVLKSVLGKTFAYVQVYTHLDGPTIDGHLSELREAFPARLLPTRGKADVTTEQLTEHVAAAWQGTIAGDIADSVRELVSAAVESCLMELCAVKREALASIADKRPDNMVQIVLSRIRDELAMSGRDLFTDIFEGLGGSAVPTSGELRKLLSVWYYSFPVDKRVRRGDIIELDGALGLVVTPACDLVSFPKKTARRLTWLRIAPFTEASMRAIKRDGGLSFSAVGASIVAAQGDSGEAIVLLPNMPARSGTREELEDHMVLCHGWETRVCTASEAAGGPLMYDQLVGVTRRCTLSEPFVAAVVTKVTAVIGRPGTPDMPKGEVTRLNEIAAATKAPAAKKAEGPGKEVVTEPVRSAASEVPNAEKPAAATSDQPPPPERVAPSPSEARPLEVVSGGPTAGEAPEISGQPADPSKEKT